MKKCPKCNTFTEDSDIICDICEFDFNKIVNKQSHNDLNVIHLSNHKPTIPHCPTCQSTNIKKISTTNKVGSAVTFGIFSVGHLSKTFKCNNCGMKF